MHEDIDAGGLLEGDILDKMKEFHRHMSESKEYLVYSNEVRSKLDQKVSELKTLEQEWFHTKQQLEECEKGLADLEQAIQERSGELKQLVGEAKTRRRLEKEVKPGQEFILYDGRKLTSLLDLKIALRTMPESVFRYHVSGQRNDFVNWILHSFEDKELAIAIRNISDKDKLAGLLQGLST